jgi:hypothetical protein
MAPFMFRSLAVCVFLFLFVSSRNPSLMCNIFAGRKLRFFACVSFVLVFSFEESKKRMSRRVFGFFESLREKINEKLKKI